MVVEGTLIVICTGGRCIPGEEVACQFQHIIGVAGLCCILTKLVGQDAGLAEYLFITVSTRYVGMISDYGFPEEVGNRCALRVAGHLVATRFAEDFRDLSIDMDTCQAVPAGGKRVENTVVIEHFGQFFMAGIACEGV